ncbi:helix-turn-helix domain-containing protein [Pleomorphomonas sp. NRK KF1]|uniref:winged helix-turn-helix transcriptional regulator n=1 Tax=Pleomorphomonas sp. NRK KF1 TaxID=2943000 RepID=UPI002043FD26|nr:helix-turn-helix domain-containing protein [Pleomorphomonas sp. NRK KF1]MCM5554656.1 helix-turn-helix transcriptional regulator [Pleomorphomonas sp. NRK KF1]
MEFRSGCPIASTLDILGDRWSMVIIRSIMIGARSFSDLLAMPEGISTNILTERLRRLEQNGIIALVEKGSGSKRGAYRLTRSGAELLPVLKSLATWGERNLPDRWAVPARFTAMDQDDPELLR